MFTKNYAVRITVYDELENQAFEMADEMTKGIISQFSDRSPEQY